MTRARYPGHGPWDEVWFVEAIDRSGAGLWVRVTLLHGRRTEVGCWASWDDGAGPVTSWAGRPLHSVTTGSSPQLLGEGVRVDGVPGATRRIVGSTPRIDFDLRITPTRDAVPMVPVSMERLGVGRTYASEVPGGRVQGTLTVDGRVHTIHAVGTLGHIHGARSRLARWGWLHATMGPPDASVVVEALAAELGTPARHLPFLTSVVLHRPSSTLSWSRPWHLVRTRSRIEGDRWQVEGGWGAVHLALAFELGPPQHAVLAAYEDPAGGASFCRNTTHAAVELTLTEGGQTTAWRTARGIGELGGRARPPGPVALPPPV